MKIEVSKLWTHGMGAAEGPYVIELDRSAIVAVTKVSSDHGTPVDHSLDYTAVPGYVDCHEHIGVDVGDEHAQAIQEAGRMILRGVHALRAMTQGGVTTIRSCGERSDVERFWIEALAEDTILGPKVVRSVTPICRTGGHAWYLSAQSDGVDAVLQAVRRNVRDGADFIKVMATGGIGTLGSNPGAAEFTTAELQALVDEAHRLNRKVAAHAHGGDGVDQAIEAGVDSIEHGAFLSARQLDAMAQRGITLVVTLGVMIAFETSPDVPASIRARMSEVISNYWTVLEQAKAAGVSVALGSDGVHGGVAEEMGFLVRAGFSPVDALDAGTRTGGMLIGQAGLGEIAAGSPPDLVFVDGDPTKDITAAADVRGVICRGVWQVRT